MKIFMMRLLALGVVLALAGCAAFKQTPDDLHRKITNPTSGHLYDPLQMQNY